MKSISVLLQRILVLLPLFFISLQVQADEHDKEDVEKISVIGSHIKRTDMEGPSPIQIIDREQIELSGHNALSDILRDLPSASLGGVRETALQSPATATGTSLRGLSDENILYLLNGNRIASLGGGSTISPSIIPVGAIERIEILKDGASALYGSDAVGGVINIVTKKGDVGGQVKVSGSLAQRKEGNLSELASFVDFYEWGSDDNHWSGKGDKLTIDASYGGTTDDINYLVGGQVRLDTPLYYRDRKYGQLKEKHYSRFGSPGSWEEGGIWNPAPNCVEEGGKLLLMNEEGTSNKCGFNFSPYMQSSPQIQQGSVFTQVDTELNNVELSTVALYSYTRSEAMLAPAPGFFSPVPGYYPVPAAVAQSAVSASGPVTMDYRMVKEKGAGPRINFLNTHAYQLSVGATAPLTDVIDFDVNLNLSGSHYLTRTKGVLSVKALNDMMNRTPPAFNPLADSDKKSDVSEAAIKITKGTHSNLLTLEPRVSGELAEIGKAVMSFSAGAMAGWNRYVEGGDGVFESSGKDMDDDDKIFGGSVVTEGEGNRLFGGVYGELSTIFGSIAELQLAARTDYYYYFAKEEEGTTGSESESIEDISFFSFQTIPFTDIEVPLSPRVALSVQPINALKFRTSWSLSFKAPSMDSMYQTETTTHVPAVDHKMCPDYNLEIDACMDKQRVVEYKRSDKPLKPENSGNFNIGLVVEPVKMFSVGLDFFQINQKNVVTVPDEEDVNNILLSEKKKGTSELTERHPNTGELTKINMPAGNFASKKTQGLELDLNLTLPLTSSWDLGINFLYYYQLYKEVDSGLPSVDAQTPIPYPDWMVNLFSLERIGDNTETWTGYPRWRSRFTMNFLNKDRGYLFQLAVNNIPGQLKDWKKPGKKDLIDYYWDLDLTGKFALSKKSVLTVGIKNLLGKERPFNDTSFSTDGGYTNSDLYSLVGRTINASYSYNF